MIRFILPIRHWPAYGAGIMDKDQYRAAIERLGLNAEDAATWLGVSRRASFNYQAGVNDIPEPVARLLRLVINLNMSPQRAAKLMMKEIHESNIDPPALRSLDP